MTINFNITNTLLILGFVLIHFSLDVISFEKINIRTLLSFSSGVAISYVLVHLLPNLAHGQAILNNYFEWNEGISHTYAIYVFVWLGFVASYSLYRLNENSIDEESKSNPQTLKLIYFWFDASFFTLYNFMIGYLVVTKDFSNIFNSLIYFIAIGLHFLMNSWGLKHHHGKLYDSMGRIVLSSGIILGSLFGFFIALPSYIVIIGEAIVTGAMILNSIRFELPIDNQGSIRSFLLGSTLSTVLFLLI